MNNQHNQQEFLLYAILTCLVIVGLFIVPVFSVGFFGLLALVVAVVVRRLAISKLSRCLKGLLMVLLALIVFGFGSIILHGMAVQYRVNKNLQEMELYLEKANMHLR